jgi:hypothetical protein
MYSHRQFNSTEACTEVAWICRNDFNNKLPDFAAQLRQIIFLKQSEIGRGVDGLEKF